METKNILDILDNLKRDLVGSEWKIDLTFEEENMEKIKRKDFPLNTIYGISLVDVVFEYNNDMLKVRQMLRNKDLDIIFTKDNIRKDLILNGLEPDLYI